MTENDRALPTPPRSRFGRDANENAGPAPGMISDRMALAAAEGRLEEFLQHEIPEGDHARNLAMMMMGMSGMMPLEIPGGPPAAILPPNPSPTVAEGPSAEVPQVPPAVLAAIQEGDVANLMGILRAEHAKRSGPIPVEEDSLQSPTPSSASVSFAPTGAPPAAEKRAGIDTAIIDELLRISRDNDVTVDWLMLRAVKLYVEEYRKTGRL